VQAIDSSRARVEKVVQGLSKAHEAVAQAARAVEEIGASVHEQTRATVAVKENMGQVADMAHVNYDAINQTDAAARELDALAQRLHETVAVFRIKT
jgi:methyl-accepting chemotaxis protein